MDTELLVLIFPATKVIFCVCGIRGNIREESHISSAQNVSIVTKNLHTPSYSSEVEFSSVSFSKDFRKGFEE